MEKKTLTECQNCNKPLIVEDGCIHAVRIQRAYFEISFDEEDAVTIDEDKTNVKCESWLCNDCYLKDDDLCRFFAKNDMVIR